MRYLGLKIERDSRRTRLEAKKKVFKNISFLKWRLRFVKHHILEQIINSFARSLLIYIGTPMVAAGLWNRRDVDHIEKQIFKKMAMVPNNINPDLVTNIMREKQPAWLVVERLAKKNSRTNERQTTLAWSEIRKTGNKKKRTHVHTEKYSRANMGDFHQQDRNKIRER